LAAGASLTVTQTVIIPPSQTGQRYWVITTDASRSLEESGSVTNNTAVAPVATRVLAPDLAVTAVSAPPTAFLGQTINVGWTVRNAGTAPASVAWIDRVLLTPGSNSLAGAITLLDAPAPVTLAAGASYTNSQAVTVPLSSALNPGPYFITVQANADGAVIEATTTNNLGSASLALSLPSLPDLTIGAVTSPATALAGQTVSVTWAVTNVGGATAIGPWQESVYLAPDGVALAQLAANPAAYPLLAVLTSSNNLAAGASAARSAPVTIPLNGPATCESPSSPTAATPCASRIRPTTRPRPVTFCEYRRVYP
jgi:hypothetical protein